MDLGDGHIVDHYKDMSLPEKGQPLVAPGVLKKPIMKKPAKKTIATMAKKLIKKRKAKAEAEGAPPSKKTRTGKYGWTIIKVVRGDGDKNAGLKFKKYRGPDGKMYRTKGDAEAAGYVE